MSRPLKLFLIAGEPSGDRLGADLISALKSEAGEVEAMGLGGPLMVGQGLQSLFPIDELSIMGLAEVLPKVPSLLSRIRQTADAIAAFQPDALITIDSPDFCLRVARRARAANPRLKTIHYVAPSVWAWRPGRAAKMARVIDHVLALLPFEPAYMQAAGMTCDFVGHPVASAPIPGPDAQHDLRLRLNLPAGTRTLCLLPGSRGGEVERHGPLFRDVARNLTHQMPDLRVVIPTLAPRATRLREIFGTGPDDPLIVLPQDLGPDPESAKLALFALSDAALAVSGTVSVELAAANCPMIVAYKANWLTTMLAKRLVRVKYGSLVNILLDQEVIPEFKAELATVQALTTAVSDLLENEAARARQQDGFASALTALGRGDQPAGTRAARSVLAAIG